jgi:DNA polymerase III alpha subunit (gram-positive type)
MSALWLILDVETTGLDPTTAGVWQLGAVLWDPAAPANAREIAAGEQLIRPAAHHWTEEHRALARRISGLTPAEEGRIAEGTVPDLAQAMRSLAINLTFHEAAEIIATSYNLHFEQGFLPDLPAAIQEAGMEFQWGPCLMRAAANRFAPEREHFSLFRACAALDLPWTGTHRALADARIAAQVGERLGVFSPLEES